MKGMEFASSGGDEKAAALGDALAESALGGPDAEGSVAYYAVGPWSRGRGFKSAS